MFVVGNNACAHTIHPSVNFENLFFLLSLSLAKGLTSRFKSIKDERLQETFLYCQWPETDLAGQKLGNSLALPKMP